MENSFIHYGHSEFHFTCFNEIRNRRYCNKPSGGLWASPVNSDEWKEFVESSIGDVKSIETSFKFKLSEIRSIYIIDSREDLLNIPRIVTYKNEYCSETFIDFEGMSKLYDAILLTNKGCKENRFSFDEDPRFDLMGWDVESLLVLNRESILPL